MAYLYIATLTFLPCRITEPIQIWNRLTSPSPPMCHFQVYLFFRSTILVVGLSASGIIETRGLRSLPASTRTMHYHANSSWKGLHNLRIPEILILHYNTYTSIHY